MSFLLLVEYWERLILFQQERFNELGLWNICKSALGYLKNVSLFIEIFYYDQCLLY